MFYTGILGVMFGTIAIFLSFKTSSFVAAYMMFCGIIIGIALIPIVGYNYSDVHNSTGVSVVQGMLLPLDAIISPYGYSSISAFIRLVIPGIIIIGYIFSLPFLIIYRTKMVKT